MPKPNLNFSLLPLLLPTLFSIAVPVMSQTMSHFLRFNMPSIPTPFTQTLSPSMHLFLRRLQQNFAPLPILSCQPVVRHASASLCRCYGAGLIPALCTPSRPEPLPCPACCLDDTSRRVQTYPHPLFSPLLQREASQLLNLPLDF